MSPKIEPKRVVLLDKGYVSLVDSMGDDQRIVDSARLSYGAGTRRVQNDEGLIDYLMRHGHTSPFEKVVFEFLVKAPLYVTSQWVRHRTGSFNFRSYRYSEAPEEFQRPNRLRAQNPDNRQGSYRHVDYEAENDFLGQLELLCADAHETYTEALAAGAAREQARIILPQTLYTEFCWTVNLHNLLHFLKLRMDEHAQQEIRVYANAIYHIVDEIVPITVKAWTNNVLEAVTFGRAEQVILNHLIGRGPAGKVTMEDVNPEKYGLTRTKYAEFRAKLDKCADSAQKHAEMLGKQLIIDLSALKEAGMLQNEPITAPNPEDRP